MDSIAAIGQGLLLGLSTGAFCIASCAPVLVPYLIGTERTLRESAITLAELAAGRLAAYLLFGAAVGILALQLSPSLLRKIAGWAMIACAVLLLVSVTMHFRTGGWFCSLLKRPYATMPALLGFVTGINVCPPFLLALAAAAALGTVAGSILLFLGFFFGTSAYFLLFIPFCRAGKSETVRIIGQITAVLAGVLYFVLGILSLITA
jgi:sulfite exporter TauE/SafE